MDRSEKIILIVIIAMLAACVCLVIVSAGLLVVVNRPDKRSPTPASTLHVPTTTTFEITPTEPVDTPYVFQEKLSPGDTVSILEAVEIPTADLVLLAERYSGRKDIPRQLLTEPYPYSVGDRSYFYTLNNDTNTVNSISATLQYASNLVYFWVEDGMAFAPNELNELMEEFSGSIYSRNREFFGTERVPGVDNDPHLYILYASNLGSAAGYHSSSDTVLTVADEKSNMHEMFYLNAEYLPLADDYTRTVLAHEFQHLIHGYQDPNEEIWLNEGFSELAVLLNGYETGGFDTMYSFNPDVQLNDWSVNGFENSAHYGASFLFTSYMLDRFGEEVTKAVVAEPENGFASIDNVFSRNNLTDPQTGAPITADDLFVDWTITNYLRDPLIGDERYSYQLYPDAPSFFPSDTVFDCENFSISRDVKQYGVEYIEVDCPGRKVLMQFSGDAAVPVVSAGDIQGKFMWSNRADSSYTSITREFDFTLVSAPITLSFDTWFDIEPDYDYLYLLAKGGTDPLFEILKTPSCSILNLTGNNYGCGYNGSSSGWKTEVVDLSRYSGQKVTLSFEYVTDEAVTGDGFVLDNLQILETGETCDFETDNCNWVEQGFARIENALPQEYLVSILYGSSIEPVQKFRVLPGEQLDIMLEPTSTRGPVVIVVSGASRYTRQESSYQIILKTQ